MRAADEKKHIWTLAPRKDKYEELGSRHTNTILPSHFLHLSCKEHKLIWLKQDGNLPFYMFMVLLYKVLSLDTGTW